VRLWHREMDGRRVSWWVIAAAWGRGQYCHGMPMPVGAMARIVAGDASEKGVCCFNRGGLRFGHNLTAKA